MGTVEAAAEVFEQTGIIVGADAHIAAQGIFPSQSKAAAPFKVPSIKHIYVKGIEIAVEARLEGNLIPVTIFF